MPLFVCQHWCMKFKPFLLPSHDDGSPWQIYSWMCYHCCWGGRMCKHCRWTVQCPEVYCWSMATEILEGWTSSETLRNWVKACIQPSSACCISSRSSVQGILKLLLAFMGKKRMVISRLKEAGLRAWPSAVQELLTDEHKLYHLAFTESNVDCKWDRIIFCD